MKTKHTPGPWSVTEHGWSQTGIYTDGVRIALIDIYDEATEENQDELEASTAANARLIAAAPDLLDALQEAKHMFAGEYPGHPTTERIFAAIEKATGEPA